MRVIAGNPAIPIRQRQSAIPSPVAEVIDRALREAEVSGDPAKMRRELAKLRYEDAADFRAALASGLTKVRA